MPTHFLQSGVIGFVVRRLALLWLALVWGAAFSFAQVTTTYSEDFVSGTAYNPGQAQVDNWENFRDGLTGAYSNITVGGSEGASIACTDPSAISSITNALNTDTPASIACDGRTWNIGTCVGTSELAIDTALCTCAAASPFTLRPDVDAGNAAWGGIGATCGPGFSGNGANVDQTLTVSVQSLGAPTDADLSLVINPASTNPETGANTFFDVVVGNVGPADASGVTVNADLPTGLAYQSDNAGGDYNSATGVWTIGAIPVGTSQTLRILAEVLPTGSYTLQSDVALSNENDTDSTPGNFATNPGEDDGDSIMLTPRASTPPIVCLGRPVSPLTFQTVFSESPGADPNSPQVGDIFRFTDVASGADALVEITGATGGASLAMIDNPNDGFSENFQPILIANASGDASVTMEITIVASGTTLPAQLDFAASGVDIDGAGNLFEYIEMSDNFVEYALNDPTDLAVDTVAPPPGSTRFISTDDTPAGTDGTDPPAPVQNGISETPTHIVTAFYTDFTVFSYTIGKTGTSGTGGAGRLNSLAFDCPSINGLTTEAASDEDFGDAPTSYGNPIHVIDSGIQLGATNTEETSQGNSPTASSDAGDDGVTLPASFQGLVPVTFDVDARGTGGRLQVFVDWNADGDFADAGEQPISDLTDNDGNDATPISVSLTPPLNTVDGNSFFRVRWATSAGLGIEDPAGNGEVEDYQITLITAEVADVSIDLNVTDPGADVGDTVTISLTVTNDGPRSVDGVVIDYPLPAGFIFQSDSDFGGTYNELTGVWTVPGPLAPGANLTLQITVQVAPTGPYSSRAEVTAADLPDPDSTPGNAVSQPAEDDTDTLTLAPSGGTAACGIPETTTPSAYAGQIFWIDWGSFNINTGASTNVTATLPDGRSVTFTVAVEAGSPRGVLTQAITGGRPLAQLFGSDVTAGQRALRHRNTSLGARFNVTSSVPLDLVIGDGEAHSSATESWQVATNGGAFETIDSINQPAFNLTGNETVTISSSGTASPGSGTPVSVSRDASILNVEVGLGGGVSAIAIGVFLPDTGDAPSGYPIAAHDKDQFNPACSAFGLDNVFIGTTAPDGDDALALASADSDGDNSTNVDDEGGLTLPALIEGAAVSFSIPVSAGNFQAWIDWNGDNDFDDTVGGVSEQVAVDLVPSGGAVSFSVTSPIGLPPGNLVARLRVASAGGLGPSGFADDGEVEDHVIIYSGANSELNGIKTVAVFDPNSDGLFALPGNDVIYTLTISNIGDAPTDADTIFLVDKLPAEVTFFNGDVDGPSGPETDPVAFAEIEATGLDPLVFADDVGFATGSTQPTTFADCGYDPLVGYDPAVTFICFNPKGVMHAGDPDPTFAVSFRARIR